jgi:hypothetical protein
MKNLLYTLACLLFVSTIWAQVPQSFKYQAVARDASGVVINNQSVGIQISIVQSSIYGASVYVETFTTTTNNFGLLNINVGTGAVVIGDFAAIDWSSDNYFVKIAMDLTGGTNYLTYSISQLLSVPYALHAKTAETATENDPLFLAWDKSTGISITESQITDLIHFTNADETDPVYTVSLAHGITGADTLNWNHKLGVEVDGSTTNEIQTISRSGLVVTLSNGGGSFQDSINVYTAGAGIKVINNVVSTKLALGDLYGGGKIFWLDVSGNHGLVADTSDLSTGIKWHNVSDTLTSATLDAIYAGSTNTQKIIEKQGNGAYAAKSCDDSGKTLNNEYFSDWYLPSKYELNLMYLQQALIGNLTPNPYWSSTEFDLSKAWAQSFSNGVISNDVKSSIRRVRAIRSF